MGADVLVTGGARASANMIFTILNQINLVKSKQGFSQWENSFHILMQRDVTPVR